MAMKFFYFIIIFSSNLGLAIDNDRYPLIPHTSEDSALMKVFDLTKSALYYELDSVDYYFKELKIKGDKCDKLYFEITNQILLGKQFELNEKHFKAIESYLTILINYENDLTPKWQHLINNYLAISLSNINAIDLSLEFNNKALKYTYSPEGIDDFDWYYVFENHALTLIKAEKYEIAVEFFKQNLKAARKNKYFGLTLHAFNNIGYCYQLDSNESMATRVYMEGIQFYDNNNMNDSVQISLIYGGLGSSYLSQGMMDSAKYFLDKGELFSLNLSKSSNIVQTIQHNLFNYFLQNDEPELAFNKMVLLEESGYKPIKLNLTKSRYYSYTDNWVEYNTYFEKYRHLLKNEHKKIKESLTKVNRYYLKLQKKQILTLNENIELNESLKNYKRQRETIFNVIIFGVILVLIILFVLSRKHLINERELIKAKNQVVEAELNNSKNNLRHQKKELDTYINSIIEKNDLILKLRKEEGENSKVLPKKILTEDDWLKFKNYIDQIEPELILRINKIYPELSKGELRLFLLIRIKLNTISIASVLGISKESVQKSRTRLRKKLSVGISESLEALVYRF